MRTAIDGEALNARSRFPADRCTNGRDLNEGQPNSSVCQSRQWCYEVQVTSRQVTMGEGGTGGAGEGSGGTESTRVWYKDEPEIEKEREREREMVMVMVMGDKGNETESEDERGEAQTSGVVCSARGTEPGEGEPSLRRA